MDLVTNLEQFTPFLIPIIIWFTSVLKVDNSTFNYAIPYIVSIALLVVVAFLTWELSIAQAILWWLAVWLTATTSYDLSSKGKTSLYTNEDMNDTNSGW